MEEETRIVRFSGNLDPRAQEFWPRSNHNYQPQIPLFSPLPSPVYYPYPPPPPPPQLLPFPEGGVVGYSQQEYPTPLATASAAPPPPQSAGPTRTLVVSSVPRDVSESIIRRELEVFGEVRGVEMERICDGIVTLHFYDLRHAERALKAIREKHMQHQNRIKNLFSASAGFLIPGENFVAPPYTAAPGLISGFPVWAHFIIPPCNAVPDGHNQGTIVVFNLDPNISTSSLKEIFQAFGI